MNNTNKSNVVDYSIEYAHIYSDEKFNHEHQESIDVLDFVLKILKSSNKKYSLDLLIDEYHPIKKTLDIKKYISKLEKCGYHPDYLCLESDLDSDIKIFLDSLDKERYVKDYYRYYEKNGKSPCSYLAASWYLKRLGLIPMNKQKKISDNNVSFVGKKIINILDKKYKGTEDKAIELIRRSAFFDHVDDIIYHYY